MSVADTELTVNVPLLRKALEWVEYQASLPLIDREWRQEGFITLPENIAAMMLKFTPVYEGTKLEQVANHCGTAYCVAGYVGQLLEPAYALDEFHGGQHVGEFAKQELGLTNGQADALFDGCNSAQTIRALCEQFAGEAL